MPTIIIFQTKRQKKHEKENEFLKLELCGQELSYSNYGTFLGMTFDKYLKLETANWKTNQKVSNCFKFTSLHKRKTLQNLHTLVNFFDKDYKLYKIEPGVLPHIRTLLLMVECGTLPLKQQNNFNKLKYCTRSINSTMLFKKNSAYSKIKLPYSQTILNLSENYQLWATDIIKPVYKSLTNYQVLEIDLHLHSVIKKKEKKYRTY